jgi:Ribonuclease G/E
VIAYPDVVEYLVNTRRKHLIELEDKFKKKILVRGDAGFSPEYYVVKFH